jgi:hypothetical protein
MERTLAEQLSADSTGTLPITQFDDGRGTDDDPLTVPPPPPDVIPKREDPGPNPPKS